LAHRAEDLGGQMHLVGLEGGGASLTWEIPIGT